MRNAKGTVRAYILDALKSGVNEKDIFSNLTSEKGLKSGNAKLHIKKAKAQFTMQVVNAASARKTKPAQQVAA